LETAFWILSYNCSENCFFCFNNSHQSDKNKNLYSTQPLLELKDFEKIINDLSNIGVRTIILTGGEPLEFNNLIYLIKKISEKNMFSLLLTNGAHLDLERLTNLKNAGLNAITLSTPRLIDSTDNVKFIEQLENYRNIVKNIIPIFDYTTIVFLISALNFEMIHLFYKNFFERDKCQIIYQPLHIETTAPAEQRKYCLSNLTKEQWKNIKEQLADWMIENNSYSYMQLIYDYYNDEEIKDISCYMGSQAFVIDAWANVFPCFQRKDLYCGNLLQNSIKDVIINCMYKSDKLIDANCISSKCLPLFLNYV